MEDNTFFQSILHVLYTTHDANELIERIDRISVQLYHFNKQDVLRILQENMSPEVINAITTTMNQNSMYITNQQVVLSFLQHLQDAIRACDVLSLTIAITPTQTLTQNLGTFCKQIFGIPTIMEYTIDPSVLGGAIVVYKGTYLDASIKRKLEEYFETRIKNKGDVIYHL